MVIFVHPFFLQGSDSVAVIAAGLPNITGTANQNRSILADGYSFNGAFSGGTAGASIYALNWSGTYARSWFDFNASRSSSIYGNSNTVQPASITLIPQIKY